jgi:toxin-antitoxin system PIN domain toxin
VILVDANLLIYAVIEELPRHRAARTWLEATMSEQPRVGLPWPSVLAFVRIASNPRLFDRPPSIAASWAIAREWLEADAVWVPTPTARHGEVLDRMLAVVDRPPLVMDAHLAALAVEHGLEVCSTDRDFARFPGLRWRDPIGE